MVVVAQASVTLSFQKDISSVWKYYWQQADTASAPTIDDLTVRPPKTNNVSWSSTEPDYVADTDLYYVECTEFSDGSMSYTSIIKSSSYQASKTVQENFEETSTRTMYYVSTSSSTPTGGSWSSTPPESSVFSGDTTKYLFTRTDIKTGTSGETDVWAIGTATLAKSVTDAMLFMNKVSNNGYTLIDGGKIDTTNLVLHSIANGTKSAEIDSNGLVLKDGSTTLAEFKANEVNLCEGTAKLLSAETTIGSTTYAGVGLLNESNDENKSTSVGIWSNGHGSFVEAMENLRASEGSNLRRAELILKVKNSSLSESLFMDLYECADGSGGVAISCNEDSNHIMGIYHMPLYVSQINTTTITQEDSTNGLILNGSTVKLQGTNILLLGTVKINNHTPLTNANYEIIEYSQATGTISAGGYISAESKALSVSIGYKAIAVVGWSTTSSHISFNPCYVNSDSTLYIGFRNHDSSSHSCTATIKILCIPS